MTGDELVAALQRVEAGQADLVDRGVFRDLWDAGMVRYGTSTRDAHLTEAGQKTLALRRQTGEGERMLLLLDE